MKTWKRIFVMSAAIGVFALASAQSLSAQARPTDRNDPRSAQSAQAANQAEADRIMAQVAAAVEEIKQTKDAYRAIAIANTAMRAVQDGRRLYLSSAQEISARGDISAALNPVLAADPVYQADQQAERERQAAAARAAALERERALLTSTVPSGWEGVVITVSQTTARRGEQATVTMHIQHPDLERNLIGIAGLEMSVVYNSERLRLDSPSSVTRVGATGIRYLTRVGPNNETYTRNPFDIIWYDSSDDRSSGNFLFVTFTVLPDAPLGQAGVNVRITSAVNRDLEKVPIAVASGGITVVE